MPRALVPVIPDGSPQREQPRARSRSPKPLNNQIKKHSESVETPDRKMRHSFKRKRIDSDVIIVEDRREKSPPRPLPFRTPKDFRIHLEKLRNRFGTLESSSHNYDECVEQAIEDFIWALEYCTCQKLNKAHLKIISEIV